MKECFGNYMNYPTCKGHNDCEEKKCLSITNIKFGECDCKHKASCHIGRQLLQNKFRQKLNSKIENCDFYKALEQIN